MPEEINRLLPDAVSDYLFTPSPEGDENLAKEGIPSEKIFLVGDIMVDSLLFHLDQAKKTDILSRLGLSGATADDRPPTADSLEPTTDRRSPTTECRGLPASGGLRGSDF
jgi:hypothetical protein